MPSPAEPRQRGQEGTSAGKRDPQRAHPLDRPADSESTSFGSWLRRQREAREVSLREIADRTKISMRYLEAMEEDRYDLLPAPVFARGFLREYARYVGLNADEVINHFLAAQQTQSAGSDDAPASGPALSIPRSGSSPWPRLLFFGLATLILLGLVALGVWLADRRRARPQSAPPPPIAAPPVSASPAVTPPSPAAPESPARALRLTLDFTGDCWVDAVIDGGRRVSEQRVQGESLQVDADRTIELTLGNVGAVDAQLNGLPLPLSRRLGEVARRTIDLTTARQLRDQKESR
ncbi:MAG TPA: RodZ domain-containing protein [Thermoanaerobaculia bacterium]|nr:RodZ domain-containing protein [Thermoanaerobaculia bacterium]